MRLCQVIKHFNAFCDAISSDLEAEKEIKIIVIAIYLEICFARQKATG